MRIAYFDCFAGAGGDMIVGSLLDAGLDFAALRGELAKLGLDGYELSAAKVSRAGLAGTKFDVAVAERHHHGRHLSEILAMIDAAGLGGTAAAKAAAVFHRLGAAEAKVHGVGIEDIHFHEVGAVDSIIDIVGSAIALEMLGIEQIVCSPIPVGSGTVSTAHGVLPVPAPATAELLRGFPVAGPMEGQQGEMTTPTAAAVFTTLATAFGPLPAMDVSAIGYGAGTRDNPAMPNLLRVFLGDAADTGNADTVVELSANIDDSTGEVLGHALGALLAAGCLDAWLAPITMKKSRPAWMLSALCLPTDVAKVEDILFRETTTIGIRRRTCQRSRLARGHVTVQTEYGPVRIKISHRGEQVMTAAPEFEDCAQAATAHGVSVKEVMAVALAAFRRE